MNSDRGGMAARIGAVIGFISAVLAIALFTDQWRWFDWRQTDARIVSVQSTGQDESGRRVEVVVECDALDEDTELWLVVRKADESEEALFPVDGVSANALYSNFWTLRCDTWSTRFNVGAKDESGQYEIRLYQVDSGDTDGWRRAADAGDHALRPASLPDSDQLLSVSNYTREK